MLAHGRDPYFPAWPDVVQLNAFAPDLRAAVAETLLDLAGQCDGVRCDMAMLMLNDVFARTWGDRAGPRPAEEYWPDLIAAVKAATPDFVFLAEAYWDLEWTLQQQGFDYCYDKRLYDRLVHEHAEQVRGHLTADVAYQDKLLRFIENHDEPRAAATFPPERARAAAVATLTQTGARLVHEGQLEGRRCSCPSSSPAGPTSRATRSSRRSTARCWRRSATASSGTAPWRLGERRGWPGNDGWRSLVAWSLGGRVALARRREPRRRDRGRPRLGAVGRPPRAQVWLLADPTTGVPTSAAATTCATGSTSSSARGAGTSSTSRPSEEQPDARAG